MKILNLKIINPDEELVRDISFERNGISFIYGDILEPKNKKATINSLGKTLLLKFIDYIYGANEDKYIVSDALVGYRLEACVLYKNKEYAVKRVLGVAESIWIENKRYTITDYKSFFEIERNIYSKQIILNKKSTEISYKTYPDQTDVTACLSLLNLVDIIDDIRAIYAAQDKITDLNKQKKEMISFYGKVDSKQIDKEIYFVDKEVERLNKELQDVSNKIKRIEISDLQQGVVEEYAQKGKQLKALKREYEKKRVECERLTEFIVDSQKDDLTSEHLLLIFDKVKQEIPEMVKREIKEVEIFHQKVYEERKEFLGKRRNDLEIEKEVLGKEIDALATRIDYIGQIIATNEVYQESIELYGKYNEELQNLVYRQGKLSQVKNVDNRIEAEKEKLSEYFENAIQIRKIYDEQVLKYRDFIYALINSIYDKEIQSYFDIVVRKQHNKARPVNFEFTIKGDTGEGVSEVKKNLMDYLICRYNSLLDIMVQDSSCYNGIDPRQVAGLFRALSNIAVVTDKQIIIAVNKYQVIGYDEMVHYISEHSAITLSENNKLLKFDF